MQCIAHRKSQFKKFSNLDVTKTSAKQNTFFNFLLYFIQLKTLGFISETHKNKLETNETKEEVTKRRNKSNKIYKAQVAHMQNIPIH